ncbi:CUB and sushi domain-containing protein 3-like isoform X7 [Mobula hypostoma]|uniref:CUB and sushi domain-containing protein 3-like isoform X7 n=1 Tax=Mobula hypostoma TaxID=723540 RepID=UPI002FC2786A
MALRLLLAMLTAAGAAGDCGRPPELENGSPFNESVSEMAFEVGTVINYRCDSGYVFKEDSLLGSRSVTCKDDSTWTPLQVKCEVKNCGNTGEIIHGYSRAPNTTFRSKAVFYCDSGYLLVGRNYQLCTADGWSGQIPTCEAVTCANLSPISNGEAPSPPYGEHWEYGMVAKYSCDKKYSLIGTERLVCTETGEWNNPPPKCKAVQCHRPEQIADGQIEAGFGPTYSYGETISYSCVEGFQMVGKSVIECRENNTFVPEPPSCTLRNCSNPGEIVNGYIQAPNTTFGSRATFSCKTGYQLVGRSYLLCAADGWDGQIPTCVAIRCAPLPPISNGIAPSPPSGEQWEYGIVAVYSCDAGYSLQGAVNLTCRETGEWNWTPPMCIAKNCGYPGEIVNGYSVAANTTFGSRAIFYCKKGFLMVGKNYRVCTATGWDGKVPVCKEIKSTPVKVAKFAEPRLKLSQVEARKKSGFETAGIVIVCIIVFCFAVGIIAGLFQYKKRCWLSRLRKTHKKIRIKPQPSQSKGEAHFDEYSDHPT